MTTATLLIQFLIVIVGPFVIGMALGEIVHRVRRHRNNRSLR